MAGSKINQHFDQYVLRGKLRQEGFERWRYSFSAFNRETSQEKNFYVELYIVNPGISPKVAVIGQKSRLAHSEADLQYALAGTTAAKTANEEIAVRPSYVLVKAGVYGADGIQLNKFIPSSQFTFIRNIGSFKAGECLFGSNAITGRIEVSQQDLRVKPELLCDCGSMEWELKFDRQISSAPAYHEKDEFWAPFGVKTVYSGIIHLNGQEYVITPKIADGYSDKSWGTALPVDYFHISSARMVSIISGKPLLNSCFAIGGKFNGKLCGVLNLEQNCFEIKEKKHFGKCSVIHDCTQVPGTEGDEKVHWTVSVHKGRFVVDIDVFCKGNGLSVRDYEIPQGERTLLKILGSGSGTGEIRVYKKTGKNLELLEHANIYGAVCEFGQTEVVGK